MFNISFKVNRIQNTRAQANYLRSYSNLFFSFFICQYTSFSHSSNEAFKSLLHSLNKHHNQLKSISWRNQQNYHLRRQFSQQRSLLISHILIIYIDTYSKKRTTTMISSQITSTSTKKKRTREELQREQASRINSIVDLHLSFLSIMTKNSC